MFRLRSSPTLLSTLPRWGGAAAVAAISTLLPVAALATDNIRLDAERYVLRSDGIATTVITARVIDDRGVTVPDGTRVRFSTTAGTLDAAVVATQGGVARVTLTSADQPGEAIVEAVLDTAGLASPAQTRITFSRDADTAETGIAWVRIDGPYVAYATSLEVLSAMGPKGGARLTYRGLTLTADSFQLDVSLNYIRANGNVTLSNGTGVSRAYRDLRFDLLEGKGVGDRLEDGQLRTVNVQGAALKETPLGKDAPPPAVGFWSQRDLSANEYTFVARSVALEPKKQMQFRNVTLYDFGQKEIATHYFIIGVGQKTLFQNQVLGYGPTGPTLDIPYYYTAQPNTVGTLHVMHGAQVGSSVFTVQPGWSLDAIQTYNGPKSTEGTVEVDGLASGDWSAQIRHGQRLDDRTTGSIFLQAPSVSNLFLTTQVTRSYPTFQLNLVGSGARTGSVVDPTTGVRGEVSGDARGQISAETYSRTLWGIRPLQYVFSTDISRQGFFGGNTAVSQGLVDTQTVGVRSYSTPLTIGHATTLAQSVSIGQNWIEGAAASANSISSGVSLLGTTTISRSLAHLGGVTFSYNYAQTPQILSSGIATATSENAHHRVGTGLNLARGDNWTLNVTASRGIDITQSTLLAALGFHIAGPWRGSITYSGNNLGGTDYQDTEYKVSCRIRADQSVALYYSTTAHRVQLDISSLKF